MNGELAIWVYESVLDSDGIQTAAEILEEGGGEALFEYVMEQREQELQEVEGEYSSYVKAFGHVNGPDTPQAFRAMFAAYCVVNEIGDADFLSQCEQFAVDAELLLDGELNLDGLDFEIERNPFDNDGLPDEHADVLFRARLLGCETDFDPSGVEDTDAFLEWIRDTGDAEAAMAAHLFEPGIPSFVIEESLPATEWEGLDPESVTQSECLICGSRHYQIETENGIEWTTGSATGESVDASDERATIYNTRWQRDEPRHRLCPSCVEDIANDHDPLVVFDGGGTVFHGGRSGNFLYQPNDVKIPDIATPVAEKVEAICNAPSTPEQEWYRVNSEYGSDTDQVISSWLEGLDEPVVDEPLIFRCRHGGQRIRVYFPSYNAGSIKEAKEFTSWSDTCALKEQLIDETTLRMSDLMEEELMEATP